MQSVKQEETGHYKLVEEWQKKETEKWGRRGRRRRQKVKRQKVIKTVRMSDEILQSNALKRGNTRHHHVALQRRQQSKTKYINLRKINKKIYIKKDNTQNSGTSSTMPPQLCLCVQVWIQAARGRQVNKRTPGASLFHFRCIERTH